jgi:hypothetical protein
VRRRIFTTLILLAAALPAGAQVINQEDAANRPAAGEVTVFAGVEARHENLNLEMLSASARPGSGSPGAAGPFNHSHGNRGMEFDVNHRLLGARIGVMTGFYDSTFTSISLTFGGMETILTQESDANTYAPQGRISARLGTGFALRLDLQAWFQEPDQHFFLRARYRYGTSWTYFADDVFLGNNLEGIYHESSHRISIDAGYDSGPFKPYAGVGTVWYRGGGEFKEPDFARGSVKNSWTVVWRQRIPFTINFGVDLPALHGAYAQLEFALLGETSVGFSLGGRF